MYIIFCRSSKFNYRHGLLLSAGWFTVFKQDKKEEKDDEDPMIVLLKYARYFELNQNIPRANEYYHKALDLLLEREVDGTWTAEEVKVPLQVQLTVDRTL